MIYGIVAYLLCGFGFAVRDQSASPISRPVWTHKTTGVLFHIRLVIVILAWFFFRPGLYAFRDTLQRKLFGYFWAIIFFAFISLWLWVSFWLASHVSSYFVVHLITAVIIMFLLLSVFLSIFSNLMNRIESADYENKT